MAIQSSRAIHLHRFDYSETSQIATFFTRSSGKIRAIAKGARREKNEFDGPIDLLACSRVSWIPRPPESLHILTRCDEEVIYRSLRRNLNRLHHAFWILYLLRKLTAYGNPNPLLFDGSIRALDRVRYDENPFRGVLEFDLFLLQQLGKSPSITTCTGCERSMENLDSYFFSFVEGGLICSDCRRKRREEQREENNPRVNRWSSFSPSPGALKTLDALREQDENSTRSIRTTEPRKRELRAILNHCFRHLLGYEPGIMRQIT